MALCLANSLVARRGFVPYDQLVRYKWWYQYGYMSSIGKCFNIGSATKNSLDEFILRQQKFGKKRKIHVGLLDSLSDRQLLEEFPVDCSKPGIAGSGALMRLAPVPLFFYEHREEAIELSGYSGQITHGDRKAYDACRYFGALIFAARNNYTKAELLDKNFYEKNKVWFGYTPLCDEIKTIAQGSYQRKGGYDDGIRGKGYIVNALEAALWAFWSDGNSFEKGVLAAVNLGDDTDTTAAIYGQLAGAYYGYKNLPEKWVDQVYAKKFILQLSKWIAYEGKNWKETEVILSSDQSLIGSLSPALAEKMFASEFLMPNVPPRWTKSFGKVSSPKNSKYNGSGSPTTNLSPSPTSAQNRSANDKKISAQFVFSDPTHDSTNSFPVFRNAAPYPQEQSTNRLSAPELQHKMFLHNDIAAPTIGWNLRETSELTSTSIDQTTTIFNPEFESTTDVPISPKSSSHVSNGTKPEPLPVFKSLPKGRNHKFE
jgi:ADP-ribosylglycohydrolase